MPRVADIHDFGTLHHVALLLERESEHQAKQIAQLKQELAQAQGRTLTQAEIENLYLKEVIAQRDAAMFGDSSEKRHHSPSASQRKSSLDDEVRDKRGHGPRHQPELPLIERHHELDPHERTCTACGGELQAMGEHSEDSEEVTVIERSFVLVRHRRQKYRCRCNGCIKTAPGPLKLKRGGRYSPEFAIDVAVGKYLDHLPLERQVRIMRREGLHCDSQTLWDQINTLAQLHEPVYQALHAHTLAQPLIHVDESHWRLMGKGHERKRWWVWGVAGHDSVYYRLFDTRATHAARKLLGDYGGIVMADGYAAYPKLAREGPHLRLVHCWMHARRHFVQCEPRFPDVAPVLDLIGELYAVEHAVEGDDESARCTHRTQLREQRSRPLIERIREWALSQRALPRSALGKAVGYLFEHWQGLTDFLNDPRIPLDNGAIERALRGVALGRKNHYGSRSKRGTEVAALLYSLMESAKLARVEPKHYLTHLTRLRLADPNLILLPHQLND